MRTVRVLASSLAVTALAGCLFRGDPATIHYFRPDSRLCDPAGNPSAARGATPSATAVAEGAAPLRLRRVEAATHLKDRMVRRPGDVEVEFDEVERWAEQPAALAERALGRALFEGAGLARTESAGAPRLDVEVRAFEAVGHSPGEAVVAIWASLIDGREGTVLIEKTYVARRQLGDGSGGALARAIGAALDEAVGALSSEVNAAARKIAAARK